MKLLTTVIIIYIIFIFINCIYGIRKCCEKGASLDNKNNCGNSDVLTNRVIFKNRNVTVGRNCAKPAVPVILDSRFSETNFSISDNGLLNFENEQFSEDSYCIDYIRDRVVAILCVVTTKETTIHFHGKPQRASNFIFNFDISK